MEKLDLQLRPLAPQLIAKLKLDTKQAERFATSVVADIHALPPDRRLALRESSPVALQQRLDEFVAFQAWMDLAHTLRDPVVVRAQVISELYVCFVYASDALFKAVKTATAEATSCVAGRATRRLLDNPVRALRNAVAHGNWCYADDFAGIRFWSRKGDKPDEPLTEFSMTQDELGFWQTVSRCTAYAVVLALSERPPLVGV